MFVGHGMVAFALVAWVAVLRGRSRERALALGALAAGFATIPDVDILYAPVSLAGTHASGVGAHATDPVVLGGLFWSAGNVVHRTVTHSLVVAAVVAAIAALWVAGRRADSSRSERSLAPLALFGVVGLIVVVTAESGPVGGVIVALYAFAALGLAEVSRRLSSVDLGAGAVGATALVGGLSHPVGDLLTGTPPAFLYPFDATLVDHRIVLSPDPTVHVLGAFGVELATVWLACLTLLWLTGVTPRVAPEATLGAGYAASVLLIPAPTLDLSYPFVFSVLATSAVGLLPRVRVVKRDVRADLPDRWNALLSALTAVTVAWAAYTVAYLLL